MTQKITLAEFTKAFCRIISAVFYPMLMPLYGIFALAGMTAFSMYTPEYLLQIKIIIAVFTFVVPALMLLSTMQLGMVNGFQVNFRHQRTVPYLLTLVSYGICLYLLYKIQSPFLLRALAWGVILSLFVVFIMNFWWKISVYTTAAGGFMGATLLVNWLVKINPAGFLISVILLCGLITFVRLYLRVHTPMQVLAGFLAGMFCMGVLPYFIIII